MQQQLEIARMKSDLRAMIESISVYDSRDHKAAWVALLDAYTKLDRLA